MPEEKGMGPKWRPGETHTNVKAKRDDVLPAPINNELDIYHVRRVVAGNPNTPKQVLARLATDTLPHIRRRVAENPKAPVDVLMILAYDQDPDVRLGVAENASTPPEVLKILASDEDADVRFGVAENPHMPEEILLLLCEDDNPYIRCRALKTMQMLAPDVQWRLRHIMQPGYDYASKQVHGQG